MKRWYVLACAVAAPVLVILRAVTPVIRRPCATVARERTTTATKDRVPRGAYVGLTKQAAIAKAEADGRPWRLGREDGESFMLTQDYNPERVTFEIDDGKITKASFG